MTCAREGCGRALVGRRRDARFCSTRCRQLDHDFRRHLAVLDQARRPLRVAYADPPYPGLSRRYYADHPAYGGEVDHRALLSAFDGDGAA